MGLLELLLPAGCAGCGAPTRGDACAACLAELRTVPGAVRPTPAPPGLPACVAAGTYGGATRELILAYKERGRRRLAVPLGDALAAAVAVAVPGRRPTVLVPVPTTGAAARARGGDHMWRLARRAARSLRSRGRAAAVAAPVRARPRKDSAQLDRRARAHAAKGAFAVRTRQAARLRSIDAEVVLVDDVLTTGATLAALAGCLAGYGVQVTAAATVAATSLRGPGQMSP